MWQFHLTHKFWFRLFAIWAPGCVQLMRNRHFPPDADNLFWQETIVVRATSLAEPPEPGAFEVLNGDAYSVPAALCVDLLSDCCLALCFENVIAPVYCLGAAFWISWGAADKTNKKEREKFLKLARCVRVSCGHMS